MSYQAEISRSNPSCFLFLIDQSGSMRDSFGADSGKRKADGVADAINRLLQNLVIKCAKTEGVRDYYNVGVIGYGHRPGPAFAGALAGASSRPCGSASAHRRAPGKAQVRPLFALDVQQVRRQRMRGEPALRDPEPDRAGALERDARRVDRAARQRLAEAQPVEFGIANVVAAIRLNVALAQRDAAHAYISIVAASDATLSAATNGWEFEIPSWKFEQFFKPRGDLLAK